MLTIAGPRTATWPHRPVRRAGIRDELRPPLPPGVAVLEAERCLECGGPYARAPCAAACPAEIDVPAFIGAIARGEAAAAARVIFAENLLGGSCARVCPVEMLCEGSCVLDHEGQRPVEIGRLQRYAAEAAEAQGLLLRSRAAPNGSRVAVIGAGPAGLVCAGELGALGYDVTVYEAREEGGGLIRYAIAPYRQVREPLPAELARIARLGVSFRMGQAMDSREKLEAVAAAADAVFLGIGLGADVDQGYPGDRLAGVWQSLAFIEAIKLGRPPSVGQRVAVIGGGNTAVDVAREALRLGAAEVTILYRRTAAEMPAWRHEIEEAREEGVRFLWLTAPIAFHGREWLEEIECQRMRLGAPDASGRPRPEPVAGSEFRLALDTAVKAIGQRPRGEFLAWIEGLETAGGCIIVDPATGRTTNPKFFAGGDAVNGGATVVEAVRAGKIAAHSIHAWLGRAGGAA